MRDENKSLREAENSRENGTSRGAERLFEAMSEINDAWVEEAADEAPAAPPGKQTRRRFPRRLAALAACFCIAFVAYAAWRVSTPEKSTTIRETDMDLYDQEEAAAEQEPDVSTGIPNDRETVAADEEIAGENAVSEETEEAGAIPDVITEETAEASDVTTTAEDIREFSESTEEVTAAAADEYDSLEDLLFAVLTELWESDTALNDGVTWAILDLADFPEEGFAALTEEEQELLADRASDAFGVTVTLASSDEHTLDEAVTDPEGIGLCITCTGITGDNSFTFSACKIAGSDGAIYFEECAAEREDGLWTWEAGGFAVS
ncbi:MAG: hypothetical protein LUF00_12550 [Lachnospiraceae bacterium]|nr:hypothetical protein [Lachnospiraceae bacterium]